MFGIHTSRTRYKRRPRRTLPSDEPDSSSSPHAAHLRDGDGGRSRATTVRLGGNDLVVEGAEVEAVALPRVEVVARGDGAAGALALAHADVLPERLRARDRRLVDLLVLVDVVARAVRGDRANEGTTRAGPSVVLLDVVLDERVRRPAVDGERAAARARVVLRVEVDRAVEIVSKQI
jgi:hypothetical protein